MTKTIQPLHPDEQKLLCVLIQNKIDDMEELYSLRESQYEEIYKEMQREQILALEVILNKLKNNAILLINLQSGAATKN